MVGKVQPFVIKIVNQGGCYIKHGSVKRKKMVYSQRSRKCKKERKENKQHRWKEDDFKIVGAITIHAGIGKKMVVLQSVPLKHSLKCIVPVVHREPVAKILEQISIKKGKRNNEELF